MPTVLLISGFRFFFYSSDGKEPIHIHVTKGDGEGKIWLEPSIEAAYLFGFSPKEESAIFKIIEEHYTTIKSAWHDFFRP